MWYVTMLNHSSGTSSLVLCGVHNVKTSPDVWYILATEDDRGWGIKSCCVSTRSEWLSHLSGMSLWYDIVGTSSVSFVSQCFLHLWHLLNLVPRLRDPPVIKVVDCLLYWMCQIYSIGMMSGNVRSCMFYCMYQIYSVSRGHCPSYVGLSLIPSH